MNFPRFTRHLLISAAIFGLILFPGDAKPEEKQDSLSVDSGRYGGIYRVPLVGNPPSLDPAYVKDQFGVAVVQQIFDGLVKFDPYLMVLPALAETWQVKDQGKTYRFVIRKNARFHNGKAVTVEDVVFSISRLLRADPHPAILPHLLKISGAQDYTNLKSGKIAGLQTINDHVLLVKLEEPHTPFLTALGMYQAKIVPKAEAKRLGNRFGQNPVGSGPFRFVSWQQDKLIRLERFSDYHAGPSFLDEIHYRIYPGAGYEHIVADFQKGKLEEMPVYGNIRQKLLPEKKLQWFHRPSLSLFFYGMNSNHPFLRHPELRKALSMAIDRQKLVNQVYKGQFEIARTFLPPGMPGYRPQNNIVVDDLSLARNYLKRALGENMQSIPILEIVSGSQSTFAKAELNLVRKWWAQLGVSVEIKFITDWPQFEAYLKSESLQIYRYAWFADMPDPDSFLYPLFASDSPVNFAKYQSKNVDQMLLDARGIIDPVKRAQLYQQIEALVLESSPIIPLFYLSIDRVFQDTVQDVKLNAIAAELMPYHRIWLKAPSRE